MFSFFCLFFYFVFVFGFFSSFLFFAFLVLFNDEGRRQDAQRRHTGVRFFVCIFVLLISSPFSWHFWFVVLILMLLLLALVRKLPLRKQRLAIRKRRRAKRKKRVRWWRQHLRPIKGMVWYYIFDILLGGYYGVCMRVCVRVCVCVRVRACMYVWLSYRRIYEAIGLKAVRACVRVRLCCAYECAWLASISVKLCSCAMPLFLFCFFHFFNSIFFNWIFYLILTQFLLDFSIQPYGTSRWTAGKRLGRVIAGRVSAACFRWWCRTKAEGSITKGMINICQ